MGTDKDLRWPSDDGPLSGEAEVLSFGCDFRRPELFREVVEKLELRGLRRPATASKYGGGDLSS